jgi:thiamine biosynthesis lipoprotein
MGTVVSFDVPAAAVIGGSLEAAVRWLHWVDRIFSPYRPDSDVSLLAAAEVTVDGCAPEVAEVISACTAVRLCSGGYFTAAPGGVFDPSGYVKGWAVERAAAILSAAGSTNHLVNGGGDVQCVGGRPSSGVSGEEPWRGGGAPPGRPPPPRCPPAPLRRALGERGAPPRFALWPAGALSLRSAPRVVRRRLPRALPR